MKTRILFPILTLIILSNCGPGSNKIQDERKTDSTQGTNISTQKGKVDTAKAETFACVRSQPEPVVKKSVYPVSTFRLNDDHSTATETAVLKNADKLTINHWGCEYYALTFRFETDRFKANPADLPYWIDKALLLMNEIENGIKAPIDIPDGIRATRNYLKEKTEYTLGEWIEFGDETLPGIVTFDAVEKLTGNKYAVTLTFSVGPL